MNENEIKDSRGFAALMRLIRPKQWIKNMFIFVPLFFGGALFHTDALLAGLIASLPTALPHRASIASTISMMWRQTAATR